MREELPAEAQPYIDASTTGYRGRHPHPGARPVRPWSRGGEFLESVPTWMMGMAILTGLGIGVVGALFYLMLG